MMFLFRSLLARAVFSVAFMLLAAPWAAAQVTYNYIGAVQTFTVPAGVRAVQIQAFGAGGGGGGSDNPGNGGAGGRGSSVSAVYSVVPGTVLKVIVGGGGGGGSPETPPVDCNISGGAGGLAGGTGGEAGGKGGNRGCYGYSGSGGGGGAATVITTQADATLLIAGGGGGGQGGALNQPGLDGSTQFTAAGGPNGLGPVANSSVSLPADAVYCAPQGGTCVFSGTMEVWYGAGSGWAVVPAANGAPCDHNVLGDPNPGVVKACYYRPYTGSWTPPSAIGPITNSPGPLPGDAISCAPQGGTCRFSGTMEVWYGAGSGWAVAPAANGAPCDHNVLGDPNFGVVKACYYRPYAGSWVPPSFSTTGSSMIGASGDGGGGGGGGGGCPTGAGGAPNPDGQSPNTTTRASGGGSCSTTALPLDGPVTVTAAGGLGGTGAGGYGQAGQPGAAGSVLITYAALTLAKSQPSPALVVGANSVYTLTVTNTNTTGVNAYSARVVDQLPANMTYVSSSGAGWSCAAAPNASGTLVTCDFTGTISANGGTAVLQITATPTNHLTVTNYAAVDPIGSTGPPDPTTCTAANTPAGCTAPVVSPVPAMIQGYGYEDLNHNGTRDAGEVGPAASAGPAYVKLTTRTGSVCNFPALAASAIGASPVSGAYYSLPKVAQGDYCLTVQRDTLLSSNDSRYPSGYIGTENPTGVIQFTVGVGEVPPLNFGMYSGSRITGTVFADNGAGGGVANNGARTGTEPGLAGITVTLNQTSPAAEVGRTVTSSDGSFLLWLPSTFTGGGSITPVLPEGYTATGGSPGTAIGGSYTRPGVNYSFSGSAGRNDSGVTFGVVAPNTLAPNGAQTAEPGGTAFYAHTWTSATGGQVTFTLANAASPVSPGWSQVLYQDNNCNAVLEASEPQVSAPIFVNAEQKICLIVKQYVPAGASLNAKNAVTLSAAFNYTNAAPALGISTIVATDITTVSQAGDLTLGKLVGNLTQAIAAATSVPARPGDTLQYALTAANMGAKPLSTLVVSDFTPAFTNFNSAACPGVLPAGMTGCALTTPAVGAKGELKWTFTGSLAPGASMLFVFEVKVDQ